MWAESQPQQRNPRFCFEPKYLWVTVDRSLTYGRHPESLRKKLSSRVAHLRWFTGSAWGAGATTLRTAQRRIQLVKSGGGAVSAISGSQVSQRLRYCKRDDVCTLRHRCDKTVDDRMALYREQWDIFNVTKDLQYFEVFLVCCFPTCTKSWRIKLLS